MSDEKQAGASKKSPMTPDKELEAQFAHIPHESRDVIQPVRLRGEDTFQFRCHPGIGCFNVCCSNIQILLTPYDILRLRKRLDLDVESFLYQYADVTVLQKGKLPVPTLLMDKESGTCPFNDPQKGCTVYEDRPVTCRYYPLGMALMHTEFAKEDDAFFFLIKEDFCQGHQEKTEWTVNQFREDQGCPAYDQKNRGWVEFILKRRSAGDMVGTHLRTSEAFYMASTNPDQFRTFVFGSSFLKRFDVPKELEEKIRTDDEALIKFAFDWLNSVMFGDLKIHPRREALDDYILRTQKAAKAKQSGEPVNAPRTPFSDDAGESGTLTNPSEE
jgi:hypothetical protein